MKKCFIIASLIAITLFSCKKTEDDLLPPSNSDGFKIERLGSATMIIAPATSLKIYQALITVGPNQDPALDELTISFSGTAPFSNQRNIRITIKDEDSTVLVNNQLVQSVAASSMSWGNPNDPLLLDKNKKYVVTLTEDVSAGTNGTIVVGVTAQFSWWSLQRSAWEYVRLTADPYTITASPYPYAPSITTVDVSGVQIQNGNELSLAKVRITSPGNSETGYKQFAFRVLFADNGTSNALQLDSLRFYTSAGDQTHRVKFTDSLGNSITSILEHVASHRKIFVVVTEGNGEISIAPGSTEEFDLRATPNGFGSSADGDAVETTLVSDNVFPSSGFRYVNRGMNGFHAKLSNSKVASSNAVPYNFVWSTKSANPHSGIFGVSSDDWYNGFAISSTVVPTVLHTRMR